MKLGPIFKTSVAAFLIMLVNWQLEAQTFTTIHSFSALEPNGLGFPTNGDGVSPAGLVLSGSTLYGTTFDGGTNGDGTIFAVNTDGTGFNVLHTFSAGYSVANDPNIITNSDGASPYAGLILSGSTLYGTTLEGGTNGDGTIFALSTNGVGFRTLHTFSAGAPNNYSFDWVINSDGAFPYARLTVSGNRLYGTAGTGGTNGNGTLFAVNTDGTGFTVLHTFSEGYTGTNIGYIWGGTNGDGADPGGMTLSGGTLYGTAFYGGTNGTGTMFAVNTNGTGFRTLYAFSAEAVNEASAAYTNSDGQGASGSLTLSGDTLYGTSGVGGTNGNGTIFAINVNGAAFRLLHTFSALYTGTNLSYESGTNSEGASPYATLILSGSTVYGTASYGGTNGNGTVFAINTNGTAFTVLHTFSALDSATQTTNVDGANPEAGLILSDSTLYGTTQSGGASGDGNVFSISGLSQVAPPISILLGFGSAQPLTTNGLSLVLQGPVGSNYIIEASTDLFNWKPFTNFVTTNSPFYFSVPPATNANQQFYRAVLP